MCAWRGERGKGDAFDTPARRILFGVGWLKELCKERSVFRVLGQPKSGGKGEVDFFETAVRDMIDGFNDVRR